MTTLLIIGAGGHGAEIAAYAQDMSLSVLGALDDGKPEGSWHTTQILGGLQTLPSICDEHLEVHFITAFGSNAVRERVIREIESFGLRNLKPMSLKHHSAWTGFGVDVGEGTLLGPNALVTTRAKIGRHTIINVKASISHDCVVGDFCNVNPGATLCGDVELGAGCYIGAGATIIEKRKIGAGTIVGAGAVVLEDLPPGVTAVGVPARIVKRQGIPTAQ